MYPVVAIVIATTIPTVTAIPMTPIVIPSSSSSSSISELRFVFCSISNVSVVDSVVTFVDDFVEDITLVDVINEDVDDGLFDVSGSLQS